MNLDRSMETPMTDVFKGWSQFHLEIAGLKLDVSEFSLKDHGFSKQPRLTALAYCKIADLERAWQMKQKATLVITQGQKRQFFHGILVCEENAPHQKAPAGYIASHIIVESHFWWLTYTYTHRALHETDLSQFIDAIICASGLDKSQFKKTALPEHKTKLRMADGERWCTWIDKELNQAQVFSRSVHDETQELIEFVGDADALFNFDDEAPRPLCMIEPKYITPETTNIYFNAKQNFKRTPKGYDENFEITVPDFKAYLGEWIALEDGTYQVTNIETKGKHAHTFDGGTNARILEPEIISVLTLRKKSSPIHFANEPKKKHGFTIHTGKIETQKADLETIERDDDGHYSVRFDAEAGIDDRQSNYLNQTITAKRTQVQTGVPNASLMGGRNHTADLPLRDGTEVALLKTNESSRPIIILGALNNAQSKVPQGHQQSRIKTFSGNQIQFSNAKNNREIKVETAGRLQSLALNQPSQQINLKSTNGNIQFDVKQDYIVHTPATIKIQTESTLVESTENDVNMDCYEGNIAYDIKKRAYFTSKKDYLVAVQSATIKSDDSLTLKASDTFDIVCDQLHISAPQGKVEFDTEIINLNAQSVTAITPGSQTDITDEFLNIKTNNALIDIKEAALNNKQIHLGGNPTPPKPSAFDEVEETTEETKFPKKQKGTTAANDKPPQENKIKEPVKDSKETNQPQNNSSSILKQKVKEREKNETNETLELKNSFSRSYESDGVCWKNWNKGELELEIKAKLEGATQRASLSTSLNKEVLKKRLEEAVAKAVSDKTEMSLNKDGKLTLTTKMPKLKDYSFNIEVGVDPQTLLPYAGASIAYEFYKYNLKTDMGTYEVTGTLTVKNTFTPYVSKGICEVAVPIVKGLNSANAVANDHKTDMAVIVIGGGMFGIGSSALGSAAAGLGMLNYATSVSAGNIDLLRSRTSAPFVSEDKTIVVNFKGQALTRK